MDILNVGKPFEFEGQMYTAHAPTIEHELMFSAWLESEAVKCVNRLRPHMTDEAFSSMLSSIPRDSASGVYDFGGALCGKALASPSGMKKLLHLIVTPQMDEEQIDRLFATKLAELTALVVSAENGDPKARAAVRKTMKQARRSSRFVQRLSTSLSTSGRGRSRNSRDGKSTSSTSTSETIKDSSASTP